MNTNKIDYFSYERIIKLECKFDSKLKEIGGNSLTFKILCHGNL